MRGRKSVHLIVQGALPCPTGSSEREGRQLSLQLADLAETIGALVEKAPAAPLRTAWLASLDQKLLRDNLARQGFVSFVGEKSLLARTFTQEPVIRYAGPIASPPQRL